MERMEVPGQNALEGSSTTFGDVLKGHGFNRAGADPVSGQGVYGCVFDGVLEQEGF